MIWHVIDRWVRLLGLVASIYYGNTESYLCNLHWSMWITIQSTSNHVGSIRPVLVGMLFGAPVQCENNILKHVCSVDYKVGVSLVLVTSELLNKSSLDSILIWIFDQTIFCSVYVLYYGCISPLSFSEIYCKITFKSSSSTWNWRKLQHASILSCWCHFCMLCLSKNSYLGDSTHELLMIPHTNVELFDDSAYKFWRMIRQVQHLI